MIERRSFLTKVASLVPMSLLPLLPLSVRASVTENNANLGKNLTGPIDIYLFDPRLIDADMIPLMPRHIAPNSYWMPFFAREQDSPVISVTGVDKEYFAELMRELSKAKRILSPPE